MAMHVFYIRSCTAVQIVSQNVLQTSSTVTVGCERTGMHDTQAKPLVALYTGHSKASIVACTVTMLSLLHVTA